jgi:pyridoxine 5-phosphate synthase
MCAASLSVNVNKYALVRNSRGRNTPDLRWAVDACLAAGAHGITVHPRRDHRHVLFEDVPAIADHLRRVHPGVELNVECEAHPTLVALVLEVRAAQCTLVPVRPGETTSDHGWDFPSDRAALAPAIDALKSAGVRVSVFMDCEPGPMRGAAEAGVDRVELYTGPYAWAWGTADQERERSRVWDAARAAVAAGLGVNAGHDLDRFNLAGLVGLPGLLEVSIGHAQICRALEVGTDQSVRELLSALSPDLRKAG